jgi:hypothetical protein
MSKSNIPKVPFFDRRQTYSVSYFENSQIQLYMALFLSKPELYERVHQQPESLKQDEFFRLFNKFLSKYYTYNVEKEFDLYTYFGSLHQEKKGERNICGGSGIKSKSANKCFMEKHRAFVELTEKSIEYLYQKYKIAIDSEKDNRTFLGHTEIWCNPSPDLLGEYAWVRERSYEDETLAAPLPDQLDISLIPLSIRNKAYQKWKNQKNAMVKCEMLKHSAVAVEEEEEDVVNVPETVSVSSEEIEKEEKKIVIDENLQDLMDEEW